jgi:hypothetical protein
MFIVTWGPDSHFPAGSRWRKKKGADLGRARKFLKQEDESVEPDAAPRLHQSGHAIWMPTRRLIAINELSIMAGKRVSNSCRHAWSADTSM